MSTCVLVAGGPNACLSDVLAKPAVNQRRDDDALDEVPKLHRRRRMGDWSVTPRGRRRRRGRRAHVDGPGDVGDQLHASLERLRQLGQGVDDLLDTSE